MADSNHEPREQLELLFERHYAAVLAYALRRGCRSLAEDVASETFAVAWRRLEDIPDEALPWLYGVARRVLANERRAGIRRERLSMRLQNTAELTATMPEPEAGRELLEAIARLPEREREALLLVTWEELTPAQAATAAGCTRVALRARLYRARKRLASWLAETSQHVAPAAETGSSPGMPVREQDPITDRSC